MFAYLSSLNEFLRTLHDTDDGMFHAWYNCLLPHITKPMSADELFKLLTLPHIVLRQLLRPILIDGVMLLDGVVG